MSRYNDGNRSTHHPRGNRWLDVTLDNRSEPRYDPLIAGSIDGTDESPHDRGIVRAQSSTYDPTKDKKMAENGDPLRTLFVGHLHPAVTDDSLRVAFQRFGTVQHVRVVRDVATGASRGYGFVTFKHESDFKDAWYDAQGMEIGGMRVLVEYERARVTKGWKPRRLGGGYGGRKESGQLRFGGRERLFRQPADGGPHPYARKPEKKKYTDPEDEPKMGVIANVSLASKSASGELSSSRTFHFVVDKHQRVKRHSL